MDKLTPRRTRTVDGETYTDRAKFDSIAVDDVERRLLPSGVNIKYPIWTDGFVYQYYDKPEVFVKEDGIYAPDGVEPTSEHNKQAYFALSVLESVGLVRGYQKI